MTQTRVLYLDADGQLQTSSELPAHDPNWMWVDVEVDGMAFDDLNEVVVRFELDPLSVRDTIEDWDLPKVNDFGHHLAIVLHGLSESEVNTYELDCFLTNSALLTLHSETSPAVDVFWNHVRQNPELSTGRIDELFARLSDVLMRRIIGVVDAFDDRHDELIDKALAADSSLLGDLTAIRNDLAAIRRVVHPQREVFDVLRTTHSSLVSDVGRRRFSDVLDVASRASAGLDAARSALSETLDAYRGAEARQATDVTKVLTVYAAIMLPLSLVAGFFGMNFINLPWVEKDWGWIVVTASMGFVAVVSLGVFVALGWIQRPSGRKAGRTLGKGLAEAVRSPVQIVGAVFEISTMPLRRSPVDRDHRPHDSP